MRYFIKCWDPASIFIVEHNKGRVVSETVDGGLHTAQYMLDKPLISHTCVPTHHDNDALFVHMLAYIINKYSTYVLIYQVICGFAHGPGTRHEIYIISILNNSIIS